MPKPLIYTLAIIFCVILLPALFGAIVYLFFPYYVHLQQNIARIGLVPSYYEAGAMLGLYVGLAVLPVLGLWSLIRRLTKPRWEEDHIVLSERDTKILIEMIENPPEPNEKLLELLKGE